MIGKLEVFVGPMFAGKTEHLIKEVLWRTYFTTDVNEVAILKPAYDRRYDATRIVSHAGAAIQARPIDRLPADLDGRHRAVFFDEIQFFVEPHYTGEIVSEIRRLRLGGVDVYCAGLDMDYAGRAFEVSAALMAESTVIHRLTARCESCGGPAQMTMKREATGGRFDVGSKDLYAPACVRHWEMHHEDRAAIGGLAGGRSRA